MNGIDPAARRTRRLPGQAALRGLRLATLLAGTRRRQADRDGPPRGCRCRRRCCRADPRRTAHHRLGPGGTRLAGHAPARPGRADVCGPAPAGRGRRSDADTRNGPSPAAAADAQLVVAPGGGEDTAAGYPLRSRCLWCREPVGWNRLIGLWVHLKSDRVRCRDRVGAWAAADPRVTTITHRLLYSTSLPGRQTPDTERHERRPDEFDHRGQRRGR